MLENDLLLSEGPSHPLSSHPLRVRFIIQLSEPGFPLSWSWRLDKKLDVQWFFSTPLLVFNSCTSLCNDKLTCFVDFLSHMWQWLSSSTSSWELRGMYTAGGARDWTWNSCVPQLCSFPWSISLCCFESNSYSPCLSYLLLQCPVTDTQ